MRYDTASLHRAAARVRAVRVDDVIDLPDDLDDDEFMALDEAVGAGEADNPNAADPLLRGQAQRLLGALALAAEDVGSMIDNDSHECAAEPESRRGAHPGAVAAASTVPVTLRRRVHRALPRHG